MKKAKLLVLLIPASILNSSFAIVFGGKNFLPGRKNQQQIRLVALVLDIFFCPIVCLPIDFATHAIYKP